MISKAKEPIKKFVQVQTYRKVFILTSLQLALLYFSHICVKNITKANLLQSFFIDKPEASFVIFFTHLCEKYYKGKMSIIYKK